MAKREALRELQSRLAERLQLARAQGAQLSWLAVQVGSERYLFPLQQSGEIFPYAQSVPVPYTSSWFKGVANLRGGLYGVVDLAEFFTKFAHPSRGFTPNSDTRLITFNTATGTNCALIVDKLVGLRNETAFVEVSPAQEGRADCVSQLFTDAEGVKWMELDLARLAAHVDFLSISTA